MFKTRETTDPQQILNPEFKSVIFIYFKFKKFHSSSTVSLQPNPIIFFIFNSYFIQNVPCDEDVL